MLRGAFDTLAEKAIPAVVTQCVQAIGDTGAYCAKVVTDALHSGVTQTPHLTGDTPQTLYEAAVSGLATACNMTALLFNQTVCEFPGPTSYAFSTPGAGNLETDVYAGACSVDGVYPQTNSSCFYDTLANAASQTSDLYTNASPAPDTTTLLLLLAVGIIAGLGIAPFCANFFCNRNSSGPEYQDETYAVLSVSPRVRRPRQAPPIPTSTASSRGHDAASGMATPMLAAINEGASDDRLATPAKKSVRFNLES